MQSLRSRPPFRSLSHSVPRLEGKPHDPLRSLTTDGPKKDVLPPLRRPLGVRERPTIFKKTRTQRITELMDHDVLMEQRRHLYVHWLVLVPSLTLRRIKEASTGYFHDLNMTRRHGGKTWIAPKVLIREDVRSLIVGNSGLTPSRKPYTSPTYVGRVWTKGSKRIPLPCALAA